MFVARPSPGELSFHGLTRVAAGSKDRLLACLNKKTKEKRMNKRDDQ